MEWFGETFLKTFKQTHTCPLCRAEHNYREVVLTRILKKNIQRRLARYQYGLNIMRDGLMNQHINTCSAYVQARNLQITGGDFAVLSLYELWGVFPELYRNISRQEYTVFVDTYTSLLSLQRIDVNIHHIHQSE
jgi:hypothetical protein